MFTMQNHAAESKFPRAVTTVICLMFVLMLTTSAFAQDNDNSSDANDNMAGMANDNMADMANDNMAVIDVPLTVIDEADAIELPESVAYGETSFSYPTGWTVTQTQQSIFISNYDVAALQASETEAPADLLLAFLAVGDVKLLLPPETLPEQIESPADFLRRIVTAGEGGEALPLTIEQYRVGEDGDIIAHGYLSSSGDGDEDVQLFIRLLPDDTYILVQAGQPGNTFDTDVFLPTIIAIIDSVALDWQAPLGDVSYDDIAQSTTAEGFPVLGNPDAPVQITEIASFDCPACARFHLNVYPGLLEYIRNGDVALTYVPVFGTGSLPLGDSAASAALCSAGQGQFWPYHDGIYTWHVEFAVSAFAAPRLTVGAEELGLDMDAWQQCFEQGEARPIIDAALAYAQAQPEYQGTPTIFVNGEYTVNALTAIEAHIVEILRGDANDNASDDNASDDNAPGDNTSSDNE